MRIPFIRLGSDKRPLAPWEERLRPFVSAILIVPLFAGVIIGTIFVVAFFLGWTLVSPVLPRSWRIWNREMGRDPSVDAQCPACRTRLALEPVDKQVYVDQRSKCRIDMPAQGAACPQCRRTFRRSGHGKIWSPWREAQTADHSLHLTDKA